MRRPYHGYYVIAALFIAEIAATGISFYSFSLFVRAWQQDPALGWSLTAINASFTIGLPLAFVSPFLGRLIDERGPKLLMLIGVPIIALGLFLTYFMTAVWHLWAIQAIIALGQTAAFLGAGKLVGLWFHRDRGRMMGIAMAGNNAGGILIAPLTAVLLESIGWRTTFLLYGIGLFLVNGVAIFLLVRDRPEEIAQEARRVGREEEARFAEGMVASTDGRPDGRALPGARWHDAPRTLPFWLIAAAFFASSVSMFGVLSQLANHLKTVEIDIQTAGTALGLLGVFGLVAKLVFGYAAEKVAVRHAFVASSVLQILGIGVLLLVGSPADRWLLLPFVVIYGLGFGATGVLMPLLITDTFGLLAYGATFGTMQVTLRLFNAGIPPLIGYSVDVTGSYLLAYVATLFLLGIGIVAIVFARPVVRLSQPEPGSVPWRPAQRLPP